jgi:hypothetical protein
VKDVAGGQDDAAASSPGGEYTLRKRARERVAQALGRRDRLLSNARLFVFVAGVVQGFLAFGTRVLAPVWLIPTVLVFVALLIAHDRVIQARRRAERSVAFYERGLARLEDRWAGGGNTRRRDDQRAHPYAEDLDLFGAGSLFELLCTARTPAGEEKLAGWLVAPPTAAEVRARQAAVAELRDRLDLREELCLLGEDIRSTLDPSALIRWGAETGPPVPWLSRAVALAASALTLAAVALALFTGAGIIPLLFAIALQVCLAWGLRARVRAGIRSASGATRDLSLLAGLLARLEAEPARCPKLSALRTALESEGLPPSRRIAELRRAADLLEARQNQFFAPLGALLLWGTHFGLAVESWRAHHGPALARWIDAAAELEALVALAAYAYEHPADPFPELVETGAVFDGVALGHPLLSADRCVRNDVHLASPGRQAYMVSGSNMSGKSTLLRTVGINTVMALAGAPVRAQSLRLSPLAIGASIHVLDSLQEGTSHFYAEIKRIRQVMDLCESDRPVLFLLDEVLHGTNSHDRRIGAEAVLRGLLARGAIGLITTHDLALARMADALAPVALNVHFQDQLEDGKMRFDYRLWPGVVTRSNALELMRAVGLEV